MITNPKNLAKYNKLLNQKDIIESKILKMQSKQQI